MDIINIFIILYNTMESTNISPDILKKYPI